MLLTDLSVLNAKIHPGAVVGGKMIQGIRFADEQAIIEDTKIGLQIIMYRLATIRQRNIA